jgi:trehalose 6-phosphate phosphatase
VNALESVHVPSDLSTDLAAAHDNLAGALAIVSGRPLVDLERLLGPTRYLLVAEHGAAIRRPNGPGDCIAAPWPFEWNHLLDFFAAGHPALRVDKKSTCVTIHFRAAPELSELVRLAAATLAEMNSAYELRPAKMAWELCRREFDKGLAVETLMTEPPFAGRLPVFVGDDIADEKAIAAAQRMGGIGLHTATAFDGKPARVRQWLKGFARIKMGTST